MTSRREALRRLGLARPSEEHHVDTRHPLEVVIFQIEEGGVVGSRAWSGDLSEQDLANVTRSGKTIREGIAILGGDVSRLASVRRTPGAIAAYLELHIEQGAVLQETDTDIGVVTGIVGLNWWEVTIDGFANHAGTTPMDRRRDAMIAAAKFTLMVNRVVTSRPGRQVGTVGRIAAFPGAPNVIPGKVVLSLELRDLDAAVIASLYDEIVENAKKIGRENGTTFIFKATNANRPAPTDERLRVAIEASARELGLSTRRLPTAPGHDAQETAQIGPAAMIFLPSVAGIVNAPKRIPIPTDYLNGP